MLDLDRLLKETSLDRVEHRPLVDSTNDLARELAARAPADQTLLVIADAQTAGRGRGANRWWTGPGSLAMSLLFESGRRGIARQHAALVSLAAAAAVVETIAPLLAASSSDARLGVHWPNDVYLGPRKLAGVLTEVLPDGRQIMGLGLNLNNRISEAPLELAATVATISDVSGRWHDPTDVLIALLRSFDAALEQLATRPEMLVRHVDGLCLQHGQPLCIEAAGLRTSGTCTGIADDGALVLETAAGTQRFYAGVLVKR